MATMMARAISRKPSSASTAAHAATACPCNRTRGEVGGTLCTRSGSPCAANQSQRNLSAATSVSPSAAGRPSEQDPSKDARRLAFASGVVVHRCAEGPHPSERGCTRVATHTERRPPKQECIHEVAHHHEDLDRQHSPSPEQSANRGSQSPPPVRCPHEFAANSRAAFARRGANEERAARGARDRGDARSDAEALSSSPRRCAKLDAKRSGKVSDVEPLVEDGAVEGRCGRFFFTRPVHAACAAGPSEFACEGVLRILHLEALLNPLSQRDDARVAERPELAQACERESARPRGR